MVDGFDRLREGLQRHHDPRYAARPTFRPLDVTSVQKTSAGGIESVAGTFGDGGAEVRVPMAGKAAARGDRILVMYDPLAPAGAELQYVRHVTADHPGAGILVVDADLPVPTFPATWHDSAIVATPGRITARATTFFNAVGEKYGPSGYIVSHRYDAGAGAGYTEWRDSNFLPHLGGVQECNLGSDFPPGCTIDVKVRAVYNWAAASSLATNTRSFSAASDDATPGNATGLDVGTGTPGTLILRALGSVDASLFGGWRYEIATGAGGPTTQTSSPVPAEWTPQGLALGTYYVAVRPVSKSGTFGGRFPASGYQGPYAVSGAFTPDTTPPPVWAAPTLSIARNQPANGGEVALLTVTLPGGYAYPADYKQTIVRFSNTGAGAYFERTIAQGQTSIQEVVPFGTTSVTLQGEDQAGNRSAASPAASATLAPTGVPGAAPTLTVSTFALALKLDWAAVSGALGYEVERAPDVAGSPGTFARIATVDARVYLDTLSSEALVLPKYWYRVRAVNLAGNGPYSANQSGTVGAVDAQNLRVNSITAAQLAGDQAMFNKITAGNLLTTLLRTAPSGARWELEGATGNPGAGQLRWYDSGGVRTMQLDAAALLFYKDATTPRAGFSPTGAGFYSDTGQQRATILSDGLRLYRDDGATLRASLLRDGVRVYGDTGSNDIYLGPNDGSFVGSSALLRIMTSVYLANDMAYFQLQRMTGGFVLGNNSGNTWGFAHVSANEMRLASGGLMSQLTVEGGNVRVQQLLVVSFGADMGNFGRLRVAASVTLGNASGDVQYTDERWAIVGSANRINLVGGFVRRAAASGWQDVVYRYESRVDNTGNTGGHLDIGMFTGAAYWALGRPGIQDLQWDQGNNRIHSAGNFNIGGTLTKAAGAFEIAHPDPAKAATHRLKHSFVESPTRGDNIYRYSVTAGSDEEAYSLPLPGYFRHLNVLEGEGEDDYRPQVIVQADDLHWGEGRGKVRRDGSAVDLRLRGAGRYTVIVYATRKDAAARAHWDAMGGAEPAVKQREGAA